MLKTDSTYSLSSFRSSLRSSLIRARSGTQGSSSYQISRRQYNQLEASRLHGLEIKKHAGVGISLIWIKFNLDFGNEACVLSAINSLVAVQQASEIDEEVIQRINPTFGLNNPRAPAPCYNIDILFACINRSCTTRAIGFYFNRPDINGLIGINNITSLVQKNYDFIGVLLRVGPVSATSGAIAVCKKGEMFKFFTHQFGESLVSLASLGEFFDKLSKKTAMMNYKHVCLFEVNSLSPKVFSRNRTSGTSDTYL